MPASNAYADLLSGWLTQEGDMLTAHIKVDRIDAIQPGIAYIMTFDAKGSTYYAGLTNFDTILYFTGDWVDPGPGSADETTGTFTPGAPAHITIEFSSGIGGNGVTELTDIGLMVIDFKSAPALDGPGYVPLDEATSTSVFALAGATMDAAPASGDVPSVEAPVPFPPALALAAVALAAVVVGRRRA